MESNEKPREIVIHQSLNRPNQLMGADRELALVSLLTSVALGFSLGLLVGSGLGVRMLRGRDGRASPDGESRSHATSRLHATHPLSLLLPGQKRPVFEMPAGADGMEISHVEK